MDCVRFGSVGPYSLPGDVCLGGIRFVARDIGVFRLDNPTKKGGLSLNFVKNALSMSDFGSFLRLI